MKYYIDPKTNELFAFELDGSQDKFIGEQLKRLDADGLAKVRAAQAEAAAPTHQELESRERALRDQTLLLTDSLVTRHRDELEAERSTTLSTDQYKQLQDYRQDLRDWPESEHFPAVEYRPDEPVWLAAHLG